VDFTCRKCAIGGATCLLRFSKSPKPRYKYERWKTPEGGISDHCVDVMPRPRPIANPMKETCPAWRDVAGRDRATVERMMKSGDYVYGG
jgi:hypothetical protein